MKIVTLGHWSRIALPDDAQVPAALKEAISGLESRLMEIVITVRDRAIQQGDVDRIRLCSLALDGSCVALVEVEQLYKMQQERGARRRASCR